MRWRRQRRRRVQQLPVDRKTNGEWAAWAGLELHRTYMEMAEEKRKRQQAR